MIAHVRRIRRESTGETMPHSSRDTVIDSTSANEGTHRSGVEGRVPAMCRLIAVTEGGVGPSIIGGWDG